MPHKTEFLMFLKASLFLSAYIYIYKTAEAPENLPTFCLWHSVALGNIIFYPYAKLEHEIINAL